jgi:hypothetical protein
MSLSAYGNTATAPHDLAMPTSADPLAQLLAAATHPLRGDEIRAIKAWLVDRSRMKAPSRAFFLSELRRPLHHSTVNLLLHK